MILVKKWANRQLSGISGILLSSFGIVFVKVHHSVPAGFHYVMKQILLCQHLAKYQWRSEF